MNAQLSGGSQLCPTVFSEHKGVVVVESIKPPLDTLRTCAYTARASLSWPPGQPPYCALTPSPVTPLVTHWGRHREEGTPQTLRTILRNLQRDRQAGHEKP